MGEIVTVWLLAERTAMQEKIVANSFFINLLLKVYLVLNGNKDIKLFPNIDDFY
jgi:hypothetical protein